ncbi:putative bifunctional diguanylate cyclase/phosphodiesterase [Actinoplanes philippinensis]|uniref:putative bifunctional diguanylate cyclase/phosphodiesterase n=1 Tax=Actinoplanes philippinensis TaxID=35752 RepID=UPI003408471D
MGSSADRNRGWYRLLLAGALPVVLGPLLGDTQRQVAYVVVAGTALVAVRNAVRRHHLARRRAWWPLAAAMLCCAVANAIWGAGMAAGWPAPAGLTVVDLIYLSMYPLLAAGLLHLAQGRGGSRWAGMTEAGIVLCTGTALIWVMLYDPFVMDRGHWPGAECALAYPALDLLLLAAATRMIVVHGRLTWPDRLLLTAVCLLTAADVRYFLAAADGGAWAGPGWSAAGWLLAFLLIGAAARHPEAGEPVERDTAPTAGRARTALVGNIVLVMVGPAATGHLLLTENHRADLVVPVIATALTALLLVLRLIHTTRLSDRHAASLRDALGEQAGLQETLRHQARHDTLTGLPNRTQLEELLADPSGGALILVDLDGFKDVNERFGHPTGDSLLVSVAARLGGMVAGGEVMARLGGDEFALLLPGAGPDESAGRGDAVLAALREPVPAGGQPLHVTASAGIRVFGAAADPVQVLSDADLALYAAKAAGKDQAAVFDVAMRQEQADRIRLLERLRAAVDADEFAVHYQPIVRLDDARPVAVEALVRWLPPGRSPVGPDLFIPAAEDSGLIVALGEWVLRRACADAAGWHRRWGTTVTVNVSPRQLVDPHFTVKALAALRASGLPAAALTLEITEGVLVRSGAHAAQALLHLSALRAEGVRVAIDDFGTGYSSLAYLRDLPIDVLKIDRSFMPADDADTQQAVLVRAIVDLATGLGLTTVAEGVETGDQAALLRALGCQRAQGYHFARPVPAAAAGDLLAVAGNVQLEPVGAEQHDDGVRGVSVK